MASSTSQQPTPIEGDGGVLRSAAPAQKVTFSHQKSLKKLPIPPLQQTLDKFLHQTVKPILNDKEWEDTKTAVESFVSSGKAQEIYDALKTFEKSRNSYIEEFWDAAYLEYDVSVAINVNPVFVLEDDPTPSRSKLVPRAVSLVFSSLKFVRAVRKEILTVDKVKDTPLCMDQYSRLFATARVPDPTGADKDVTVTSPNSTHIVVICQGQFYYFQALTSETFELAITERELTKNIEMIIQDAESHEARSPVGVLTAETRNRWRNLRKSLCAVSVNNQRVLEVIDSALFVVCLDVDYEPPSVAEAAANILHGTTESFNGVHEDEDVDATPKPTSKRVKGSGLIKGETMSSRWYDKLMLIIARGGTAGVNFEHSAFDGHTVLRFASDVFTDTIIRFAQTISGGIACHLDASSLPRMMVRPDVKPRKLEFDLTPDLERCIHYAKSRLADAIHQNHTTTLEYTGYGKNFLVQNGLSPDATVQLGIQTAFFELYGEPANTYESVLTKAFYRGRTEAGRSCTAQAVEFMRAFTGINPVETEEKIRLLRQAASAHSKMTGECSKGMGVDRLLYALECLWTAQRPNEPKPDIFRSPGWLKLNQSVLSTSNCGNPSLRFFGFGPVCPQGFGVGYIIKDDAMHFMITSKRRQTDQFRKTLARFFERVHDDLIAIAPSEAAPVISLMMFRGKSFSSDEASSKKEDMEVEEDEGYDFFGLNAKLAAGDRVGRELN